MLIIILYHVVRVLPIGGNVALLNVLPAGGGGWGGGGQKGYPPPQPSYMSEFFGQRVNNFHIIAAFQCYNCSKNWSHIDSDVMLPFTVVGTGGSA
jgi:hypothetical protein